MGSHPERLLVNKERGCGIIVSAYCRMLSVFLPLVMNIYITIIEPGGSVDKPEAEDESNRLVQRMWMGCGQTSCPQPIHILALSPG